jgi:hypothetical protein
MLNFYTNTIKGHSGYDLIVAVRSRPNRSVHPMTERVSECKNATGRILLTAQEHELEEKCPDSQNLLVEQPL